MKNHRHTLKNGLQVILVDSEAFPSITTLLLVGAGSRYENKKNNGVAHFFEHMAFKGSKKYPSSLLLASTIESLGAYSNAFTSKDYTGYWIKAPSRHFETVCDVIADMITSPILAKEEIEREKGVIIEEINMYEDTPQRKVAELFENLLYQGNPLGFDIAGKKETVNLFTKNTFVDYMKSLYHPSNAVLIVAGGITKVNGQKMHLEDYTRIIDRKFRSWANGQKVDFKKMVEKQNSPQSLVHYKKTEQAHFCLGFRTFNFDDDRRHALAVLSAILGKGMSSRLFIRVREREGLCYYIGTYTDFYTDVGNMLTHAGISINIDKVKKSVSLTLDE